MNLRTLNSFSIIHFGDIMMCNEIGAAQGWVAVGFGEDRAMGRDAVLMATASTLTSRWNEGMPKQSIKTEDIGVKNATVQGQNSVVLWFSQRTKLDVL